MSRSSEISWLQEVEMSAVEYLPYRTLRTRTSATWPWRIVMKSHGSHGAFTATTRKPNHGAYRIASAIATLGGCPRVIRPPPGGWDEMGRMKSGKRKKQGIR
jgi:hypothetical protein